LNIAIILLRNEVHHMYSILYSVNVQSLVSYYTHTSHVRRRSIPNRTVCSKDRRSTDVVNVLNNACDQSLIESPRTDYLWANLYFPHTHYWRCYGIAMATEYTRWSK